MTEPTIEIDHLRRFISESNAIEGLHHPVTDVEMKAHFSLLRTRAISDLMIELQVFVNAVAPGHRLRSEYGLNVRVGHHHAPPGGPKIERDLASLITMWPEQHPFRMHCRYETLHPFTDGNGRSGRALWLWHTLQLSGPRALDLTMRRGFLHSFYYQTLTHHDSRQR